MRPFLADAAYVNYLGEVDEEGVRAAYGRKYQRLAELKDKYDPTHEPKHQTGTICIKGSVANRDQRQ